MDFKCADLSQQALELELAQRFDMEFAYFFAQFYFFTALQK